MENHKENSQSLTTRSGFLANSETSWNKLAKALGEPITPKQLTDQMARLNAAFGTPKDRSSEQLRVMANEWFKALRNYGEKTLRDAVSKSLVTCKWWPTLAEIAELCRSIEAEWKDVFGTHEAVGGPPRFTEKKDPDLTPGEVAMRIASVKVWKEQYGWNKVDEIRIGDESETRASQDMTVSSALLRSCAARRSRGLSTCEASCSRVNCELKDCEE